MTNLFIIFGKIFILFFTLYHILIYKSCIYAMEFCKFIEPVQCFLKATKLILPNKNQHIMSYTVTDNTEKKRFEIHEEGYIAFEDYELFEGGISYLHTDVPKELEGRGIASALAKYILDYAEENNLKVKPYCPYIKAYIDKHAEYQANSVFHNPELAYLKK